jgi:hypothetical protein
VNVLRKSIATVLESVKSRNKDDRFAPTKCLYPLEARVRYESHVLRPETLQGIAMRTVDVSVVSENEYPRTKNVDDSNVC